jgi:hypothetical protein
MKIKNNSGKYEVYEAEGKWFLNFGQIKKNEKQIAKLEFSEVDSKNFSIQTTCGCTSTTETKTDLTTVNSTIEFNGSSLPKTIILQEKNKRTELKLIGNILK